MIGMGLLTLATGLLLMSHGGPAAGRALGEPNLGASSRGGFIELHPTVAIITAILIMAHLLLNRGSIRSYARGMVSS